MNTGIMLWSKEYRIPRDVCICWCGALLRPLEM